MPGGHGIDERRRGMVPGQNAGSGESGSPLSLPLLTALRGAAEYAMRCEFDHENIMYCTRRATASVAIDCRRQDQWHQR